MWNWPARLFLRTLGYLHSKGGDKRTAQNREQHVHTKKQDYLTVNSHDPLDTHVKIDPLLLPLNRDEVPSRSR